MVTIKRAPFTLENIEIGDSLYFETTGIYNEDITWTVIEKRNDMLRVKPDMGNSEPIYIRPEWVKKCESYDSH